MTDRDLNYVLELERRTKALEAAVLATWEALEDLKKSKLMIHRDPPRDEKREALLKKIREYLAEMRADDQ